MRLLRAYRRAPFWGEHRGARRVKVSRGRPVEPTRAGCCAPCYGPPCPCDCHTEAPDPIDEAERLMRIFDRQRGRKLPPRGAYLAMLAVYGLHETIKILGAK